MNYSNLCPNKAKIDTNNGVKPRDLGSLALRINYKRSTDLLDEITKHNRASAVLYQFKCQLEKALPSYLLLQD